MGRRKSIKLIALILNVFTLSASLKETIFKYRESLNFLKHTLLEKKTVAPLFSCIGEKNHEGGRNGK